MVIIMKYKYGTFNDNQFSDYIELLHNKIHWLLIYQENSYPKLDNYFNNLQLYIAALAELIPSPYIIDLANTIECAKLEFNNPNFNHQKYRKIIFDAHSIIDKIGDNHE